MPRPSHGHEPPAIDHDAPHAPHALHDVIVFDRAGVRAIDRAAIDEYGIPGVVLMENAARGLYDAAMPLLAAALGDATPGALIVCGTGNNGGDGYALARRLHNHHVDVVIAAFGAPAADSDAAINRGICEAMRLPIVDAHTLPRGEVTGFDLIVDAIFGTGLDREVGADAAAIIRWINAAERPVLAVDMPSGMDCDTGKPLGACVKATVTATFVGVKPGFLELGAQKLLGETVVIDIGAPRELIARFGRIVRPPARPEAPEHAASPNVQSMRRRD